MGNIDWNSGIVAGDLTCTVGSYKFVLHGPGEHSDWNDEVDYDTLRVYRTDTNEEIIYIISSRYGGMIIQKGSELIINWDWSGEGTGEGTYIYQTGTCGNFKSFVGASGWHLYSFFIEFIDVVGVVVPTDLLLEQTSIKWGEIVTAKVTRSSGTSVLIELTGKWVTWGRLVGMDGEATIAITGDGFSKYENPYYWPERGYYPQYIQGKELATFRNGNGSWSGKVELPLVPGKYKLIWYGHYKPNGAVYSELVDIGSFEFLPPPPPCELLDVKLEMIA